MGDDSDIAYFGIQVKTPRTAIWGLLLLYYGGEWSGVAATTQRGLLSIRTMHMDRTMHME
jgi:hypothetical protein